MEPEKPQTAEEIELDELGGEPLVGSGFEEETPEDGFSAADVTVNKVTMTGGSGYGKRSAYKLELAHLLGGFTFCPSKEAFIAQQGASALAPDQKNGQNPA